MDQQQQQQQHQQPATASPTPQDTNSLQFVRRLAQGLASRQPALINSRVAPLLPALSPHHEKAASRASVAAIFRLSDLSPLHNENETPPTVTPSLESVLQYLDWGAARGAQAQLFFIKRAEVQNDRWSGHVAFPGGRQEKGETALQAAVRETMEEVGLPLDDSFKFVNIGRLDDRWIFKSGKGMVISPFVFLQVTPSEIPPRLQPTEVADARWIPVHPTFTELDRPFLPYDIAFPSSRYHPLIGYLSKFLGLSKVSWPSVYLPFKGSEESCSAYRAEDKHSYLLWGLTLGMALEIVLLAGYPVLMNQQQIDSFQPTPTHMHHKNQLAGFCHVPVLVASEREGVKGPIAAAAMMVVGVLWPTVAKRTMVVETQHDQQAREAMFRHVRLLKLAAAALCCCGVGAHILIRRYHCRWWSPQTKL